MTRGELIKQGTALLRRGGTGRLRVTGEPGGAAARGSRESVNVEVEPHATTGHSWPSAKQTEGDDGWTRPDWDFD